MEIAAALVGHEQEPLITIDGFAPDPAALRAAAAAAKFVSAGAHYPGIRAPLPPDYLATQLPIMARAITRHMARCRRIHVVDASFSMVTAAPAALSLRQRVPHVDAYGRERIALVHFLSDHPDGTAFYRHRATGFETVNDARAPRFFAGLETELADAPAGYIAGDTPLFERTAVVAAAPNRALLYRSYMLHSGAIAPDADLSPEPMRGRLTVTGFFAIE